MSGVIEIDIDKLSEYGDRIKELEAEVLKYGAEIDRLQTENEELHGMLSHLLLDPRDPK